MVVPAGRTPSGAVTVTTVLPALAVRVCAGISGVFSFFSVCPSSSDISVVVSSVGSTGSFVPVSSVVPSSGSSPSAFPGCSAGVSVSAGVKSVCPLSVSVLTASVLSGSVPSSLAGSEMSSCSTASTVSSCSVDAASSSNPSASSVARSQFPDENIPEVATKATARTSARTRLNFFSFFFMLPSSFFHFHVPLSPNAEDCLL